MKTLIALLTLTLTACASTEPTIHDVTRPINRITVIENPRLASEGLAVWDINDSWCVVILKRYPRCLKHEIRHCLEGKWHGDKPSAEDCY